MALGGKEELGLNLPLSSSPQFQVLFAHPKMGVRKGFFGVKKKGGVRDVFTIFREEGEERKKRKRRI